MPPLPRPRHEENPQGAFRCLMKIKCPICGKITGGRKPRGGDGTFLYPRRHRVGKELCEGVFMEGEWITEPAVQLEPIITINRVEPTGGAVKHTWGRARMSEED